MLLALRLTGLRLWLCAWAQGGEESLLEAWGLVVLIKGFVLWEGWALVLEIDFNLDFLVILKSGQIQLIELLFTEFLSAGFAVMGDQGHLSLL